MSDLFDIIPKLLHPKKLIIINKILDKDQGSMWIMVYKQYECKAPTYQPKSIGKNIPNQKRQNQGKYN